MSKSWMFSSADPEQIATTAKGLLVGIIPLVLIAGRYFNVEIGQGELQTIADSISNIIIAIGGVVSMAMTLYGLVRKLYVKITQKS